MSIRIILLNINACSLSVGTSINIQLSDSICHYHDIYYKCSNINNADAQHIGMLPPTPPGCSGWITGIGG